MKKTMTIFLLLALIVLIGCQKKIPFADYDLQWSVSEDRTTVFGTLANCRCLEADIEMLVTDENTGEEYWSTFTITWGKRFERPVGVSSDFTSIDLSIIEVR